MAGCTFGWAERLGGVSSLGGMTDPRDDATKAAQNVTDSVSSYQSGAEEDTVREELDKGLEEAGVEVSEDERKRLTQDIAEGEETPDVREADPAD